MVITLFCVLFCISKIFSNRRRAMKQTKPTCAGKTHVEQQDKGRNGWGSSGKGKVPVGSKQPGAAGEASKYQIRKDLVC